MRKPQTLVLFVVLVIIGSIGVYISLPTPGFPSDPPNTLPSTEPADIESIYRRSFYTQLSRSELMAYYDQNFQPNIKLNHPPEESGRLIRDQTRSSWLEEILHPGKDSLYINGFYPIKSADQINIAGTRYVAKITVRYIPSEIITRLTVLGLITIALIWLLHEYELV